MSTKYDRQRRDAAFKRQKGRCYYCQCQMIQNGQKAGGGLVSNACTLEHLDDRYSPARGQLAGERRVVAACYACNNRRAQDRNSQFWNRVKTGHPMPDRQAGESA
jgi:DNA-binding helix-hairpin-helix protein with protein kinase domain